MKTVSGDMFRKQSGERFSWKQAMAEADEALFMRGDWALIAEGYAHATATSMLKPRYPDWNFTVRTNPSGGYDYWAQKNGLGE